MMPNMQVLILCILVPPLLALSAPAAPADSQATLEVAKDGSALGQIVLPEAPSPAETFAAQELQKHVQQISGATLAVVSEPQAADGSHILVGKTGAAGPVLADLQKEDRDAFAVRRIGRDLVLVGPSDRATLYAVYDLLERDLGCRWLAPGAAWKEVPTRSHVAIAAADRTERPGLKYRYERMTYLAQPGSREHDCLVWAVRQRINIGYEWPQAANAELLARCGGFRGFMWPHPLPHLTDMEKLVREHPDWLALVKGKRQMGSTPVHTNLCTTNPEVIEFVTRLLSKAFDAQPEAEILPLGPGDGVGFCECERCRALDTGGSWSHAGTSYPLLADRWLTFVNAVAERLAATHPDKKIYTLAYHQTFAPPVKVRPRPNVMIMVVNSRPEGVCFVHPVERPDCTNNALFCRHFQDWRSMTPAGMMAYQYIPHSTFCRMPLPAPHKFVSDIRWLSQTGCVGYEAQSGYKMFGLYGLSLYAVAKAMWNPSLNPDALVKDYCDAAFHEASEPMQRFFAELERGQREAEHTSTGIWTCLTPGVLARANELLQEARSAARDEEVRSRLAAIGAHFSYARMACEVYRLAEEAAAKRDPKLLDEAESLARRMDEQSAADREATGACLDIDFPANGLSRVLGPVRNALKRPATR